MKKDKAYYEEVDVNNELKLREMLKELPPFCKQFFIDNYYEDFCYNCQIKTALRNPFRYFRSLSHCH